MRSFIIPFFILLTACDNSPQNIALGTLERDRIAHTATANEVITALPVLQGTPVSKGTILVKLDDTLQKAAVAKAQAEVEQAQASLEKLQNGARKEDIAVAKAQVKGAKAAVVESKANFSRSKKLLARKAISSAAYDTALAARDSSLAHLQTAQAQLKLLTNGARKEDLQIAQAHLNASLAILASEQKKLSNLTIKATRDGILDNLPWNLGERVTMGSPLAIVLAGKAPYARVYIPEPYRVKMTLGLTLNIHIDGLEKPLKGKLRWIATEPAFTPYYALNQEERARLMYLAEFQLADEQAHLANGIPVQVELP